MSDQAAFQSWWEGLTGEQRARARAIASGPAPRGMAVDDLAATMIQAGLPTSRQIWTGQPEFLVEMAPCSPAVIRPFSSVPFLGHRTGRVG